MTGLCALWLVVVGLIVLSPVPVDRGGGRVLRDVLATLRRHGVPGWIDYGLVEFAANVLMFVPLGLFFFVLAPGGWRWLGPLVGLGLSALIETTQLSLLPQRVASPYDVVANTLGTVLGTLLGWALLRTRRRRR